MHNLSSAIIDELDTLTECLRASIQSVRNQAVLQPRSDRHRLSRESFLSLQSRAAWVDEHTQRGGGIHAVGYGTCSGVQLQLVC